MILSEMMETINILIFVYISGVEFCILVRAAWLKDLQKAIISCQIATRPQLQIFLYNEHVR